MPKVQKCADWETKLPVKSAAAYKAAWHSFVGKKTTKPKEGQVLAYLKKKLEGGYCCSTLWTTYSQLRAVHVAIYGAAEAEWKEVRLFLKRSESSSTRQVKRAETFEKADLVALVGLDD